VKLEQLNREQQEAVINTDGPIMILAGAGSGKTRTLVTRINYLIEEKRISPYQILAVTFSNKAAKEMKERILHHSSFDLGSLNITTFHAFCARLLRAEANYLGLSKSFTIYDDSESKAIIKTILGRRGISQKEINPSEVDLYIETLKNQGYFLNSPDDPENPVEKNDLFFKLFVDYETELHKSNAVDFGGLITGVLNLFHQFPEVLERYQKRFKYILVDEYQDTNRAQFKLVTQIATLTRNICVVGDEDQSIYSWRGADIRNILDFEKVYPDVKILKLEQNYRSTKKIITAATHVIAKNSLRKGKNMWTENDEGEVIEILEFSDDRDEAFYIAARMNELKNEGVSLNDIALFYRNNSQSRQIEDELRKQKIHYRIVAGIKFYDRKEIKDMLAYMRVVTNPKDSLALSRIINTPVRGIGAASLRKIEEAAIESNSSLWDVIYNIVKDPYAYKHLSISPKVNSSLASFVNLIEEVKVLEQSGEKPSISFQKLLNESLYFDMLKSEKNYEAQARVENIEELINALMQHESEIENANLTTYLETVTLDGNEDQESGSSEQVSLMTIHGSKGLEYPYVFITGCEESVFPSFQSIEGGDQKMEEERRLFYVAMTRAMKKLYLSFAQGRMLWGQIRFNGPSRFLMEIPSQFYQWTSKLKKKEQFDFDDNDYDDFNQEVRYSNFDDNDVSFYQQKMRMKNTTFPKGSKIKHKIYGAGEVLDSEGSGSDEKVTIKFKDGIRKKFMVKFAPLEIIK
jgi:DNA helicase-2/ATP-dependent DNA helicase PcrA